MSRQSIAQFIENRVRPLVNKHPVITSNPYTSWFAKGEQSLPQIRDFIFQYAGISKWFIVFLALKVANAFTFVSAQGGRDVLATEIGVGIDILTGSPEGKNFTRAFAHELWIQKTGMSIELNPRTLGRRNLTAECTQNLLRKLQGAYASGDSFGVGASFGLEVWAGFGIGTEADENNFWSQIVRGIKEFNARHPTEPDVDDGFFKLHHDIEIGHTKLVYRELEEHYDLPEFDPVRWEEGVKFTLDALYEFWCAMDERRLRI